MKVVAYNDDSAFETLQPEWNDLVARSSANTIFSTWEWQSNWWRVYHPGDLWLLAIRDDADKLVGIASFFITDEEKGRTLHFVGSEDVTDYLDLIIDTEQADKAYKCLVGYIAQASDKYDRMVLCNIPQQSPSLDSFVQALTDCRYEVKVEQRDVCPVIRLDGTWDDYLEALDKKQRHELRRKLRRAEGAQKMGVMKWHFVDDTHDMDAQIEQLFDLMRTSQHEKAKFLQDEQHVAFFKSIIPLAHKAGWLNLSFLTMNDKPISAYLNFDYHNHILVYNSGIDPSQHGNLSPGIVLLAFLVQDAIDKGCATFDFLRGDEEYKYRMGAKDTAVYTLIASPASA